MVFYCFCNSLGPYFTPVDLASFAQSLDDEERLRMAEGDVNSEEYQTFLQQPSSNYDDSGFFSIQVNKPKGCHIPCGVQTVYLIVSEKYVPKQNVQNSC